MKKAFRQILAAMLCAGVMTVGINTEAAVQEGSIMHSAEKQTDRVFSAGNTSFVKALMIVKNGEIVRVVVRQ